ncbi:MAG TPA: hypothetical protein VJ941_04105, partial [Gracilimonas sp.]|nr:hypothetical protein [Gracilimonas sp.]
MKNLFFILPLLLLMLSCNENPPGPPFELKLSLQKNTGQVPPILALTMGGNYVFEPQYPGEPMELPITLKEGEVIYGILDLEQYVVQGFAEGFIDSSVYQRNMMLVREETVTEQWVDVIFTVAVGEDQNGNMMVIVEGDNGDFDEEDPVFFEPSTVVFQDNVFEVMEAGITARMEYYNGKEIVEFVGPASLLYLSDTKPSESLQLYF